MTSIAIQIHKHIAGGGCFRIDLVEGDSRVPITNWWNREGAEKHAADLAFLTGFDWGPGDPCPACLEAAVREEQRLTAIGVKPKASTVTQPSPDESPKAPTPLITVASVSPDEAPV